MTLTTENGELITILMAGRLLLLQEGNLDSKCGALHVQVQRKVCGASTFFGHVLGLRLKDVGFGAHVAGFVWLCVLTSMYLLVPYE